MTIKEALADARKRLANGDEPSLVAYMLRDWPETEAAGLFSLAWVLATGYPHRNDVLFLIENLEAYIDKNNAQ